MATSGQASNSSAAAGFAGAQYFQPPAPLEVGEHDATKKWKAWRQQWESYWLVTGLSTKDAKVQVAMFILCVGQTALHVYNTLPFERPDKEDMSKVLQLMEKHYVGETNAIYERYMLNSCGQATGQTFDNYLTKLRTLSQSCNYGKLENGLFRDRIVCGVKDDKVRKTLLQTKR